MDTKGIINIVASMVEGWSGEDERELVARLEELFEDGYNQGWALGYEAALEDEDLANDLSS